MIFRISDIGQALSNLKAQKTRTLLTALGIVFGVGQERPRLFRCLFHIDAKFGVCFGGIRSPGTF